MKRLFLTTSLLLTFYIHAIHAESFKWAYKTDYNHGFCVDANDNLYATGTVPVIKYNISGKEVMRINAGKNDTLTGYAISVDANGNIYLTGMFSSEINFGNFYIDSKGKTDIFCAKFSKDGTPLWLFRAGGTGYDAGNIMDIDTHGNMYIAGFFSGSATFGSITLSGIDYRDIFVMNCDSNGVIKWIQSISGTGNNNDYVNALGIAAATPGKCIVSGVFGGTAVFAGTKYKAIGNSDGFMALLSGFAKTDWVKTFANSSINTLKRNNGGDIFAGGRFSGKTDIGSIHVVADSNATNVLLVRFDSLGNPKWVQKAGGNYYDGAVAVTTDSKDNLYVSGYFSNHALFGNTYLNSLGEDDVFYAKYDGQGNRIWVIGLGDQGEDAGGFIGVNKAGDQLFVSGSIQYGNVNFGTTTLSDNGDFAYIAAIGDINTGILPDLIRGRDLKLYPNPSQGNFSIKMDKGFPAHSTVSIYDLCGNRIAEIEPAFQEKSINLSHLQPGIYIVRVLYPNGMAEQKLEIQ